MIFVRGARPWLSIIVLLAVWWATSQAGWLNDRILPGPWAGELRKVLLVTVVLINSPRLRHFDDPVLNRLERDLPRRLGVEF